MRQFRCVILMAMLLSGAQVCHAWHGDGHAKATQVAMHALEDSELPTFFKQGVEALAREVILPDVLRNRATPQLHEAERPEHYIDLEMLEGNPLPDSRPGFYALCQKLNVRPEKVGFLPYACMERTQRLAMAFAELRRHPDDPHIQAKCLIMAGSLAHYVQDLAQPLHVTIDFDGRGKPGSGIHARMDALLGKVDDDPGAIELGRFDPNELAGIVAGIDASHRLVDKVYELDGQLPDGKAEWKATDEVRAFAMDRLRAAAGNTADAFLAAWRLSESIQFPTWFEDPEPTTQPANP